jgi:hypothetical protein
MSADRATRPVGPATVLFVAALLVARPAHAQPPQDTTRIPSPVLLKRVAEAVDGHRTGRSVYVVASYRPPHNVLGVFERRADAEAQARAAGPSVDVFGPYRSPRDPGAFGAWLPGCFHNGRSVWDPASCPDRPVLSFNEVDSITITVRLTNGDTRTFPLPKGTDAAFFTLSAIDKFVIPYYTQLLGVDSAAAMRQGIVQRLSRR